MVKEIYLAGGCFWGTEHYLQNLKGIIKTEVGYANGNTQNPTYEEVCHNNTGHAEVVKVQYEHNIISLSFILTMYYDVINPTLINRQGGDKGTQYRTGIYYTDESDKDIITKSINNLQKQYDKPIVIEVLPLLNYYKAEEYHQKYLDENPSGYCHIGLDKFEKSKIAIDTTRKYQPKNNLELKNSLNKMQYYVTQESGTEPPYNNEYYNHFDKGIYVDITTGEPLFVSADKFESGCGWPAFSKPIDENSTIEIEDKSKFMHRTEVRSKTGNTHLGHVFEDGPKSLGGLRYCINSAALRFIPMGDMQQEGYGDLLHLLKVKI